MHIATMPIFTVSFINIVFNPLNQKQLFLSSARDLNTFGLILEFSGARRFSVRPLERRVRGQVSGAMADLLGEDRSRCRLCTSTAAHQLHFVPHGDLAAFDHEAVERELAVEAPIDATGDFLILDQRVGVV